MQKFVYRNAPMALIVACVALLLVCQQAAAINFKLPADTKRCFTEEVPSGADFKLSYAAKLGYAQFVDTSLIDPAGIAVVDDKGSDKGTHAARASTGGDYTICFKSRTSSGVRRPKVDDGTSVAFAFKVGSEGIDYSKLATREKLKPMEIQLRMIEDTVRSIHGEYLYYKEKEAEMRSTNEHMTSKVVWMAVIVIIIFIIFSYLQLRHLKSYFRKKRMID